MLLFARQLLRLILTVGFSPVPVGLGDPLSLDDKIDEQETNTEGSRTAERPWRNAVVNPQSLLRD